MSAGPLGGLAVIGALPREAAPKKLREAGGIMWALG
jgi:hypothetical protein